MPWQRLMWAVAMAGLGAVHTLAYSQTSWWPLALLTMGLLVLRLARGSSPAQAALHGAAYGVGWLAAGVWWLFISMHRYGGLPAPLAAAAVLALSLALSLYLAGACAVWVAWRARLSSASDHRRAVPLSVPHALALAAAWAGLWMMAELARGQWFTGFPWVASGYALVDSPLAGWAPWLGVYGMGALAAGLVAAWVLTPWRAGHSQAVAWGVRVALAMLVLGLPWLLPTSFTHSTGLISVSLLQTDIAQDEKFAAERLPQQLQALSTALLAARGQLVVAPETAVPLLPYQLDAVSPGYWASLAEHFGGAQGRVALIGVPLGDESGYTNSAVSLGAATAYRYDKHHLVPFGEFIPRGFRWFTEALRIPLGDFARGPVDAAALPVGSQRIGPNICYEDLFGEELAVRFQRGTDAPTLLVNLSNIGWFGDTVALPQHLNISRLRTLEFERPMLRSTNTGMTAIIDHRGQVRGQLPPLTLATLDGEVEGRQGLTPYAYWVGRWGLTPLWAIGLVLLTLGRLPARRA